MTATVSWAEHAKREFAAAGFRSGGARDAVIEFLDAQDCCVTAQAVHNGVAARRRVGIATVYRVLEELGELRLVHRVDLGDGTTHFEPAQPGGAHHHHVVCDGCGAVDTFDDAPLERSLSRVARGLGYRLAAHDVVLHGVCRSCQAA